MNRKSVVFGWGTCLALLFLAGCAWFQPPVSADQVFLLERGSSVTRQVTFNAQPQNVGGKKQAVEVTADSLPTESPPKPPAEKGLKALINTVIEPRVRAKETGETLYDFDPPLSIAIEFTAEDANAAPRDLSGKPQLSIYTYYKDSKGGWHWQKWDTTVICDKPCDRGTLKASIKTLHPNDPIAEGSP
jgi:hypothetical protein